MLRYSASRPKILLSDHETCIYITEHNSVKLVLLYVFIYFLFRLLRPESRRIEPVVNVGMRN